MFKKDKLKQLIKKAAIRFPVFHILPKSTLQERLICEYFKANNLYADLLAYAESKKEDRFKSLAANRIIVQAAFKTCHDELLEEILKKNIIEYPKVSYFYVVLANLKQFQGKLDKAYYYITEAHSTFPKKASVAAKAVDINYNYLDNEAANEFALNTVKSFPLSSQVLWAVCKNCKKELQMKKIFSTWWKSVKNTQDLAKVIRPLANSAQRAENFDLANKLFLKASLIEIENKEINKPIKSKKLKGKNSLTVISDLMQALEPNDIPFFLHSGTALGIVREGKPLDHDNDIDIGILEDYWEKEKILDIFIENPYFKIDKPHPKSPKIYLLHRNGISVDIFKFYKEKEYLYHNGVFVRWRNTKFNLKTINYNGIAVKIPEPEDKYLTECYGNWRIPESGFDVFVSTHNEGAWPGYTEVIWPEYYKSYLIAQVYKKIRANNIETAKLYLNKAKDTVEKYEIGKELIKIL